MKQSLTMPVLIAQLLCGSSSPVLSLAYLLIIFQGRIGLSGEATGILKKNFKTEGLFHLPE